MRRAEVEKRIKRNKGLMRRLVDKLNAVRDETQALSQSICEHRWEYVDRVDAYWCTMCHKRKNEYEKIKSPNK